MTGISNGLQAVATVLRQSCLIYFICLLSFLNFIAIQRAETCYDSAIIIYVTNLSCTVFIITFK